jgi:hypothetical protein
MAINTMEGAKKRPLFQIVDELSALLDQQERAIEAQDQPAWEACEVAIKDLVSNDLAEKTDAVCYVRRLKKALLAEQQELLADVAAKCAKTQQQIDQLENALLYAMVKLNVPSIQGNFNTISKLPGRDSLDVFDESKVPPSYFKTVEVRKNAEIRADLDRNIPVPGARLKSGDEYIRFTPARRKPKDEANKAQSQIENETARRAAEE